MKKNTYNFSKNRRGKAGVSKGFSMVEMLIVTALISLLSVSLSSMIAQSFKNYRVKSQTVDMENKSAQVMRRFEQSVRAATSVTKSDPDELIFYRFFDLTSPSPVKVRYFMDGSQFKIGLTNPSGTEPNITYPSEQEVIDLIVPYVVDTGSLFTYYDGSGAQLSGSFDSSSVRMIGLSISLDKDQNSLPGPVSETTKVTLRNVKDNL